jgi:hypothetical protein
MPVLDGATRTGEGVDVFALGVCGSGGGHEYVWDGDREWVGPRTPGEGGGEEEVSGEQEEEIEELEGANRAAKELEGQFFELFEKAKDLLRRVTPGREEGKDSGHKEKELSESHAHKTYSRRFCLTTRFHTRERRRRGSTGKPLSCRVRTAR